MYLISSLISTVVSQLLQEVYPVLLFSTLYVDYDLFVVLQNLPSILMVKFFLDERDRTLEFNILI